jgi:hypothetical protein
MCGPVRRGVFHDFQCSCLVTRPLLSHRCVCDQIRTAPGTPWLRGTHRTLPWLCRTPPQSSPCSAVQRQITPEGYRNDGGTAFCIASTWPCTPRLCCRPEKPAALLLNKRCGGSIYDSALHHSNYPILPCMLGIFSIFFFLISSSRSSLPAWARNCGAAHFSISKSFLM